MEQPGGSPIEFEQLIKLVAASGAEVVLIGGLAVILQGGERSTKDVDFAYRRTRQTAQAIAKALKDFHPRPVDFPEGLPFVWDEATLRNMSVLTLTSDLGRIDFLSAPEGVESVEALLARAVPADIDGVTVLVASIEDLIAMKQAANRDQDRAHIAELETLRRLSREQ